MAVKTARWFEVFLMGGAQEAHEDGPGLGSLVRAVAAGRLAVDDGGTNGVLGGPVGGLEVEMVEEAEQVLLVGQQVAGEAPVGLMGEPAMDHAAETGPQQSPRHPQAVVSDLARIAAVPQHEGVLEHRCWSDTTLSGRTTCCRSQEFSSSSSSQVGMTKG